jgi:hypothetical protein
MPESTIETPDADKHEFRLAEYHEAATSSANGVEIGFNSTKAFFAINTALIAIFFSPTDVFANADILLYLQGLAPIFGVISSFILAFLIQPYFGYLDNRLTCCVAIEDIYDGKLFKGNEELGRRWVDTQRMLFVLAAVTFLVWGYQLYQSFVST